MSQSFQEKEKATVSLESYPEEQDLTERLGYRKELKQNRSLLTLLFQSLSIAAIPYGFGGPILSAIYGGGNLTMWVGWLVVLLLDECIALSLGEPEIRTVLHLATLFITESSLNLLILFDDSGIGLSLAHVSWIELLVVPACHWR